MAATYSAKNGDVLGTTDDESSQASTKGRAVEDTEVFLGCERERDGVCERKGFGGGICCGGRGERRVGEG